MWKPDRFQEVRTGQQTPLHRQQSSLSWILYMPLFGLPVAMLRPRSCCDAHWLQNDQTVLKNYKSPCLSLLQTQFHNITFHHVEHVTLMCLVSYVPCSFNYYLEVHINIRLWEDWNGRSWILAQLVNLVMLAVTFLVHSSHGPFMERKCPLPKPSVSFWEDLTFARTELASCLWSLRLEKLHDISWSWNFKSQISTSRV